MRKSSDPPIVRGSSLDSPLEEAGFEPSVPRDTPKFSTPAHVTCLTPCTRTGRREREMPAASRGTDGSNPVPLQRGVAKLSVPSEHPSA